MLKRCIFCRREFQANAVLEHFPVARHVAYDPEKGRLWAVCGGCGRWTLAPFETRWEALEELEQSVGSFRTLGKTENIALFRTHHLQVVRIGNAPLREQAWWRYGRRLLRRRFVNLSYTIGLGTAAVAIPAMAFGPAGLQVVANGVLPLGFFLGFSPEALKAVRFGWTGWRGPMTCLRCGRSYQSLSYMAMSRLRVVQGRRAGELGVRLECSTCHKLGLQLNDVEAELFVRRYLAHRNMFGAPERRVRAAADRLEAVVTSRALVARHARERTRLRKLDGTELLAFEMALSDASERVLLDLKLAELEARWREAEQIAVIADGELTPSPVRG